MIAEVASILDKIAEAERLGLTPCISYGRVSSAEQIKGRSLEFQIQEAQNYAAEKKLHIVFEVEAVESASKVDRKNFNRMLVLAKRHNVKHLLFKDASRISRNISDSAKMITAIEKGELVLHTYSNSQKFDVASDPNAITLLEVSLSFAKNEARTLGRRIKFSHTKNRADGVQHIAPPGYTKDKVQKRYVFSEDKEALQELFDLFDDPAHSWTLESFAEHLNKNQILSTRYLHNKDVTIKRTWTKSNVEKLVKNPFYHGEIYSRTYNTTQPGTQDVYYSKERFLKRLKRLGEKKGGRRSEREFLFSGLLRCDCGKMLTPEHKTGRHGKGNYVYYSHRCQHTKKSVCIKEEHVWLCVDHAIEKTRFSEGFAGALKELFTEIVHQNKTDNKSGRQLINGEIAKLEAMKDKAFHLFLTGAIDDSTALNLQINRINEQIKTQQNKLGAFNTNADRTLIDIAVYIEDLRDLPAIYLANSSDAEADKKERIAILRHLIKHGLFTQADGFQLVFKEGFKEVLQPEIQETNAQAKEFLKVIRTSLTLRAMLDQIRTPEMLTACNRVLLLLSEVA